MLCAVSFNVLAQPTQGQIDYAKSRIGTKELLDTVCLAHTQLPNAWVDYWYIIKRVTDTITGDQYALLMGHRFLDMGNIYRFNETGNSVVYQGSTLQAKMKSEYPYQPELLRAIAVNPDLGGTTQGARSKPKLPAEAGTAAGDAMFPPSYQEMLDVNDNSTLIYNNSFLEKAYKDMPIRRFWSRSPYPPTSWHVWEIDFTLGSFVGTLVSSQIGMVGMVWVRCGKLSDCPTPDPVTISASGNDICSGTQVTFTAMVSDDDPSITYQWKKNGYNISGANSPTYTYTPANGDVITCVVTSTQLCIIPQSVESNSINMVVISQGTLPSITIQIE